MYTPSSANMGTMRAGGTDAKRGSLATGACQATCRLIHAAIITTARNLGTTTIASRMFARWCQENFFSYMMQHYDIDGLIEYGAQELPGTTLVINPERRELEKTIKRAKLTLKQYQARLATYTQGTTAGQEAQTPP